MLFAYVLFGFALGLFMSLVWKTSDWVNVTLKVMWVVWTLWSAAFLLGMMASYMKDIGSTIKVF